MKNRDQHTIPRAYLQKFVDPDTPEGQKPYLWVIDCKNKAIFNRSAKNLEVRKYYYSIKNTKSYHDDSPDKILQDIESRGLPVLDKLDKGFEPASLKIEDRASASEFIAMFYLRVPAFHNSVERFAEEIAKKVLQMYAASPEQFRELMQKSSKAAGKKITEDLESVRRTCLSGKYLLKTNSVLSLEAMFKLKTEIEAYIINYHWRILEAPKNTKFITSNRPLVMVTTERPSTIMDYSAGWETPWMEATVPLSPRNMLLISLHHPEGREIIDEDGVIEANRRTYAFATRVYSIRE